MVGSAVREPLRMQFAASSPVLFWFFADDDCGGFTWNADFLEDSGDAFDDFFLVLQGHARPNVKLHNGHMNRLKKQKCVACDKVFHEKTLRTFGRGWMIILIRLVIRSVHGFAR
jgi:hypothetical protein